MNRSQEGDSEVILLPSSMGSLERVCVIAETGQITLESCERHIKTMKLCSQEKDCHCFLVDLSEAEFVAGIAAQYDLAYQRAEQLGLCRSWKIALLTAPGDKSHDFFEIVAQNAGYSLRGFDDVSAAMKWLVA